MAWEKVKLGDVATFSNGVNFGKDAYAKGVKLIGVSNFGNRIVPDYGELEEISANVLRETDYLKDGDIVFVRSNGNKELVGRCMLIENPQYPVTYSGFCIRARFLNTSRCNPRFFNYYFKTAYFRNSISGSAVGANIQNLNQGILSNHIANVPNIKTQKKIADILSVYDNLIENNQKQIKLLEEAAQRLYKEWFIDLRFPGHETTKIVDGFPEGWIEQTVSDFIFQEIGGGWGEDGVSQKSSLPAFVIRGADIDGINHGDFSNIPFRFHSESNLEQRTLQDGDIVFEVSGGSKTEGVAKTLLITDKLLEQYSSPVICASFCKKISPKEGLSQYFYDALRYMRKSGITSEYDKKSARSIVNYRWKDFLSQQHLVLPSENVLRMYDKIAKPIYKNIQTKSIEIEKLKQARDRLLPKLMSGDLF